MLKLGKKNSYSDYGDRSQMTREIGGCTETTAYTYNLRGQLTQETETTYNGSTTNTYSYNARGDMTQKIENDTNTGSYSYDSLGRMSSSVSHTPGGSAYNTSYNYSAEGERIKKTTTPWGSSASTTYHAVSGGNIVYDFEITPGGQKMRNYTFGAGGLDAFTDPNGSYGFYVKNAHGDVVQLAGPTNAGGSWSYDAFGNVLSKPNNIWNPYGYCGEYTDFETGLVFLRARYYNPNIGRFTQEDPIRDGSNWYVYCDSDPVNKVDPSGLAYQPSKGIAYAKAHYAEGKFNRNFPYYSVDCTNFVSQCLYAGGMKMEGGDKKKDLDKDWYCVYNSYKKDYYPKTKEISLSWRETKAFKNYWKIKVGKNKYKEFKRADFDTHAKFKKNIVKNIKMGDVVQLGCSKYIPWHSVYITFKFEFWLFGDVYYSAHTGSRLNRSLWEAINMDSGIKSILIYNMS